MCGRYYIDEDVKIELEKIVHHLDSKIKGIQYTGDIKPSMTAPVLYCQGQQKVLGDFQWGFHKYQGNGLIINARAETVFTRKMFSDSIAGKRCIIPASGFYEWDSSKNKFRFTYGNKQILYMAGLFQYNQNEKRFVIITTAANVSMQPVHDRMPVILEEDMLESWLYDNSATKDILRNVPPLLSKYSEMEQMRLEF